MLAFDEGRHEYRWQGGIVPHVTGILKPLTDYGMVDPDQLEIARQKGVAVHRMVELHCQNDLDADALPEWMRPALTKWERFVEETGFVLIASERRVYHKTFGYAGTLDLRCLLPKLPKMQGHGIIDIKRSFAAGNVIGLQTAAYADADDKSGEHGKERIRWRASLRLREDQPIRLHCYENQNDFNVFLAALTLHRWKEQHQ